MLSRTLQVARYALLLPLAALRECPLDSPTPIAEASSDPLDSALAGTWRCLPPDDSIVATITLISVTPTKLFARIEAPGEKPDSVMFHSAKSGKTRLVNFEDYGPGAGNHWGLAEATLLRPNVLQIRFAVGELAASDTGSARRKVVARVVKEDRFGMALVCARTPAKKTP